MKLSRDVALKIHWIFDQLVPPVLRDSRWFMHIFLKMAFRHCAPVYLDFKEKAYRMTEEEFTEAYRKTSEVAFERETDLNLASIAKIFQHLKGTHILEVGCGGGYLSRRMSETHQVTAVDIVIQPGLRESLPNVIFQEANVEALPFPDHSFDTLVCTHTLEHVRDFHTAVKELRRVAKRLIIVVPRQRPYSYTFDLHLNFFPYHHSFRLAMGKPFDAVLCEDAGGDIFYVEDCI